MLSVALLSFVANSRFLPAAAGDRLSGRREPALGIERCSRRWHHSSDFEIHNAFYRCKTRDRHILHACPSPVSYGFQRLTSIPIHSSRARNDRSSWTEKAVRESLGRSRGLLCSLARPDLRAGRTQRRWQDDDHEMHCRADSRHRGIASRRRL